MVPIEQQDPTKGGLVLKTDPQDSFGMLMVLALVVIRTDSESFKASPKGWHDTLLGITLVSSTKGNNVQTIPLAVPNKSGMTYDYPWDSTKDPKFNLNVAITNAFYVTNTMHVSVWFVHYCAVY